MDKEGMVSEKFKMWAIMWLNVVSAVSKKENIAYICPLLISGCSLPFVPEGGCFIYHYGL